jgi:uncharacterized protein YjeT (DUF2065 family)
MLLTALGMVLLIEGLMPLAFPSGWRAAMQRMAELLRAGRAPAAIMGEVRLAGRGPR